MSQRDDDPAFIFFPEDYRWSMGLLLCLCGSPWGGAELDEVNRVGNALKLLFIPCLTVLYGGRTFLTPKGQRSRNL